MKQFLYWVKRIFLFFSLSLPLLVFALNLNTASKKELQSLKGVGAKKAEAIIRYRQRHGPFTRIEEVMAVKGIGKKIFDKNKNTMKVDEKINEIEKEAGRFFIDINQNSADSLEQNKQRFKIWPNNESGGKATCKDGKRDKKGLAEPIYPIHNRNY